LKTTSPIDGKSLKMTSIDGPRQIRSVSSRFRTFTQSTRASEQAKGNEDEDDNEMRGGRTRIRTHNPDPKPR